VSASPTQPQPRYAVVGLGAGRSGAARHELRHPHWGTAMTEMGKEVEKPP